MKKFSNPLISLNNIFTNDTVLSETRMQGVNWLISKCMQALHMYMKSHYVRHLCRIYYCCRQSSKICIIFLHAQTCEYNSTFDKNVPGICCHLTKIFRFISYFQMKVITNKTKTDKTKPKKA